MIQLSIMKLTVDTNIFLLSQSPHRQGHDVAVRLIALSKAGACDICATTRIDIDVQHEPLRSALAHVPRIGSVVRISADDQPEPWTRIGNGDMIIDDETDQEFYVLMDLLFPGADKEHDRHQNRIADVDHLIGHKLNGRDVFVTQEKAILVRQKQLAERHGITVMALSEVVDFLESAGAVKSQG